MEFSGAENKKYDTLKRSMGNYKWGVKNELEDTKHRADIG